MVVWLKCPVVGSGKNGDSYRPSIVDLPFFIGVGWSAVYYPDNPPYEFCLVRAVIEEHLIPPTAAEKYNADELKTFCDIRPHFKNRWLDQPHYPAPKYEEKPKAMQLIDPVETRYFRSDKHTINTYTVYKLLTTNSGSSQEFTVVHDEPAGGGWSYVFDTPEAASFITEQLGAIQIDAANWTFHGWGKISSLVNVTVAGHQYYWIYKVTEAGAQTSLGATSWSTGLDTTYDEQDVVWSCPETAVIPTDAIQVLDARFRLETSAGCTRTLYFRCGDGSYPSRITGFSWTEAAALLPAEFIVRQLVSQELLAEFESGQGATNLLAELISRQLTSQELKASFFTQIPFEELPAEFISRHADNEDLAAEFDVRRSTSQDLLGEFISRQPGSQELVAGFDVRRDASQELKASFFTQIPFEELPAEFISRHADNEDLAAEFESGQGWENLLGGFIVRHSDSQGLKASFDGQATENLLAKFTTYRDTQQELIAGFEVAQDHLDLQAGFLINQVASLELLGILNIIHFLTLPAEFIIQRSTTSELSGAFSTLRDGTDQELLAKFISLQPAPYPGDLLAGFDIQQGPSQLEDVVISENPGTWVNLIVNVGTGFLSAPAITVDDQIVVFGADSLMMEITYQEDSYDYIRFGWRSGASVPTAGVYFHSLGTVDVRDSGSYWELA